MKSDDCLVPHRLVGSLGEIIHDPATCEACGGTPAPAVHVSCCAECREPGWRCQCPTDDIPESRDEMPEDLFEPQPELPALRLLKPDGAPVTRATRAGLVGRLAAVLDGGVLVYADPELVRTG